VHSSLFDELNLPPIGIGEPVKHKGVNDGSYLLPIHQAPVEREFTEFGYRATHENVEAIHLPRRLLKGQLTGNGGLLITARRKIEANGYQFDEVVDHTVVSPETKRFSRKPAKFGHSMSYSGIFSNSSVIS
jgi:hypothetical protein